MRVLQINTVCKSGSTGKIAYDIHKCLLEKGHASAICYGRGPIIDEPNLYKFSSNFGVKIHGVITRLFGIHGLASNWSTHKLIRFIKNFRPEIVHIHNLHGYYVNIYKIMNYLKKNDIKTVWTLHDDFMFTGNCGYAYNCEKWQSSCGDCENIKEYPKSLFFDFTSYQYRLKIKAFKGFNNLTIVTPSKWLADRVHQSFLKDKNIHVIHNGIDLANVFYMRDYSELKEKHGLATEKIVLSVMPDFSDERKGGRYILELAKKTQGENIKIIIVGVNKQLKDLPDNILTIERTENQIELAKYYSMADVFVITSICENFPTVCLEALACGTPIVGFNAGGTKETAPAKASLFVEVGNIDQLYHSVIEILCQDGDVLSTTCRDYSINNHSTQMMYSHYINIYKKLQ